MCKLESGGGVNSTQTFSPAAARLSLGWIMTEEGAVVQACLEYLKLYGAFVWRNNSGALKDKTDRPVFFGKPGSSDIIGILPGGRFIAVECKSKSGKVSEKQKAFLAEIERLGGIAIIARSVDDVIAGVINRHQLRGKA